MLRALEEEALLTLSGHIFYSSENGVESQVFSTVSAFPSFPNPRALNAVGFSETTSLSPLSNLAM